MELNDQHLFSTFLVTRNSLCIDCASIDRGCVLKQCAFALNFEIFSAQELKVWGVAVLWEFLRRLLGQQGLLSADWR